MSDDMKEVKTSTISKQENTSFNLISSFKDIFRYVKLVFTHLFKISSKSKDTSSNISSKSTDINQSVKKIDKKVDYTKEEPKTFWAKVWKVLNSDLSSKGRKVSKRQMKKLEAAKVILQKELNEDTIKRGDKAKVYVYQALTNSGKLVTGRLYGFSKMDINSFLLNEGYEPCSIINNKWIDFLYGDSAFSSRRMSNKDLIFWLTQLSTYVKAGITLTESMKILMNQTGKNKTKLGIHQSIVYELTMGASFSEAIAKQGDVFPPLLINMLKAAEATGELEETLDDMMNYYTEIETTRKEMISAMTYPVIVTLFALGVITFILIYVIPQFSTIYESMDVKITGMTLFLLNFSSFLQTNIFLLILIFILIVLGIVALYKKVKSIRKALQIFAMKLPVFGNIIMYNEMAIFSKTFSSLLKNNVNITESIDILSKITNNEIYKEIMITTINNIAVGDRISEAFKDQWAVPEVAYYMIVTGESTGQLAEMMNKVSQFYQEQHRNLINSLKSLIEPIMIILLAVMVGIILISVIVPMFDMYDKLTLN